MLKALIRIYMIVKMLYVYSNIMESLIFIENKIGEIKKKKVDLIFLGLYVYFLYYLICFV